jgi:hypothetical protein
MAVCATYRANIRPDWVLHTYSSVQEPILTALSLNSLAGVAMKIEDAFSFWPNGAAGLIRRPKFAILLIASTGQVEQHWKNSLLMN